MLTNFQSIKQKMQEFNTILSSNVYLYLFGIFFVHTKHIIGLGEYHEKKADYHVIHVYVNFRNIEFNRILFNVNINNIGA